MFLPVVEQPTFYLLLELLISTYAFWDYYEIKIPAKTFRHASDQTLC